jgi:hypothetical protein
VAVSGDSVGQRSRLSLRDLSRDGCVVVGANRQRNDRQRLLSGGSSVNVAGRRGLPDQCQIGLRDLELVEEPVLEDVHFVQIDISP